MREVSSEHLPGCAAAWLLPRLLAGGSLNACLAAKHSQGPVVMLLHLVQWGWCSGATALWLINLASNYRGTSDCIG